MGSIKKVLQSIQGDDQIAELQREVVETMSSYANCKSHRFVTEITDALKTAGDGNNKTVPITVVLASRTQVAAYTDESEASIDQSVKEALRSFLAGTSDEVLNGLAGLLSKALYVFLSTPGTSTGTLSEYYVLIGGNAFIRLDIKAWYVNVSASSLYPKMHRTCAFAGVKSVVDICRLDFPTFLYLLLQELKAAGLSKAEIDKEAKHAKELYEALKKMCKHSEAPSVRVDTPPASSHISV